MIKEIRFRLNADEAPSLPGAYAMAIELTDKAAVSTPRPLPTELSSAVHQSRLGLDETLRHNS
jgi:hypothetical protein